MTDQLLDRQPRRRGRPAKAQDEVLTERTEIRMTKAQRAKYERAGGQEWVRQIINALPD